MEFMETDTSNYDLKKRSYRKRRTRKNTANQFFAGIFAFMLLTLGGYLAYHYIGNISQTIRPRQTNNDSMIAYQSGEQESTDEKDADDSSIDGESSSSTQSTAENDTKSTSSTTQSLTYSECGEEKEEIYECLANIATISEDHAEIYEKRDTYPSALLRSLVLNDELLNFVKGYSGTQSAPSGGLTEEEMNAEHPLFLQWDERWGYTDYGNSLMAVSACGPTCLSMAVVALTGNKDATPYQVAQFSLDNDYRVIGNGTKWSLISEGAKSYGLNVKELPLSESVMKQAIDQGKMIILIMGPGHFTTSGHYIVIYDYDENGFYVNDPNSRLKSEKVWDYEVFSGEVRNLWALSN